MNDKSRVKSKELEKMGNNAFRPVYFIAFIVMLIVLTMAYASLAVNLGIKVNGAKKVDALNWNIQFENIQKDEDSVTAIKEAKIDESKTGIEYEIALNTLGDFYSFSVDIANTGTMDAKIYDIIEKTITDEQRNYIEYYVRYTNGDEIKKDDTLDAGEKKNVTVMVRFREDLEKEDLPVNSTDLDLSYKIVYIEK